MSRIEPRAVILRSGARVLLRCPEPADADATLCFEQHMLVTNPYLVVLPGESQRNSEQQAQWLREHLDTDGWIAIIATPETNPAQVIGKISFRNGTRLRLAHHGTFGIAVHADWRGMGVGRALIAALLDWAAAHPTIEKVCLGVWASNLGAQALYRSMGFREEGRSAGHFRIGPGEYVDDLSMAIFVKPGPAPEGYSTWRTAPPR